MTEEQLFDTSTVESADAAAARLRQFLLSEVDRREKAVDTARKNLRDNQERLDDLDRLSRATDAEFIDATEDVRPDDGDDRDEDDYPAEAQAADDQLESHAPAQIGPGVAQIPSSFDADPGENELDKALAEGSDEADEAAVADTYEG
jgi:hypothetical protein